MKEEFEKQARFFHLGEQYFWFSAQNSIVEQRLLPHLKRAASESASRPLRILDLGCGPGNTLRRFAPYGKVYGFDFSHDAVMFARSRGIRDVLVGDSSAIPIASASIDCILALDVLEHVADDESVLREIARVLRRGGVFFFTVPAFMALWRYHDVMYGHYRRYTRAEFSDKLYRAGLQIDSCHFFKCAFFPLLWILAKFERAGLFPERDSFFAVPQWLNRLMEAEIIWESKSGVVRWLPFGVSLLCLGHR